MKTIKDILALCLMLFVCFFSDAQITDLKGQVSASSDLGSIHILNITAQEFTITNDKGQFIVPAKLNDTILVSSIQYIPQHIIISETILKLDYLSVQLEDRVNELDEVLVGKVLTGDLLLDIGNSEAKRDINFYDVGIPGYTGKPKTQKERKLYEADAGKMIVVAPLFVGINIHKILNRISGRTKKLKKAVKLEAQTACMNAIKSEFSSLLFKDYDIEDHLKIDFFYFVAEDPRFEALCKADNDFEIYEFLLQKLYMNSNENLQSQD
ncbi:hypothetical protein [Psychroserpens damuponensis]|uniref:hypothetical protein n=1 Tax=Psychroserpens damuponensis TaxID=943936 RepID=UPI000693406A|nr:hypothetical protein [Psychroserpens damuponensis]